jgi:hypothetical protein
VILVGIGLLFTLPYAFAVIANLYGQFSQRTQQAATAALFPRSMAMHAADGGPDQPQASPDQTGNAGAVAATCVSDPRTQPWRVWRKPGSQPKVRPGTVAADRSRFLEGATPA